uniref:Uncharacterized protein n=1 Tax=Acrobeloides nanus TaxID=290746 RepID=A0A914CBW5_9BILA
MCSKLALFALIFTVSFSYADIGDDVSKTYNSAKDSVKDAATTNEGAKWCPVTLAGTKCPASSVFHYYKCCGDILADCCFNFQTWVIIVFIVLGVLILASCILSLFRFLFCRRN